MKKGIGFYTLLGFFITSGLYAGAQKANYRRADKFLNTSSLVNSLSVSPHFIGKTDTFWYTYRTGDGLFYYFVDPAKKLQRHLFNREKMTSKLTAITHLPLNARELQLQNIFFKEDNKTMVFSVDTFRFEYDIHNDKLVEIEPVKKKPRNWMNKRRMWKYSPDSTYAAFVKNHNVYCIRIKDSVETQLTEDGTEENSYGSNYAKEIRWFGNSRYFFISRRDMRKVHSLYVIGHFGSRPHLNSYKYAMPGDLHVDQYELHIFDVLEKKHVKADIDKWKDQHVSVHVDGEKITNLYIVRKKRTCDELEFCKVNPDNGKVKILIHEIEKPYFNSDLFQITFLNKGKDIIWWSERTGRGHFYLYDENGNFKNTITSGDWTAGKIIRIDTSRRTIYFEGYGQVKGENPYYARVCKADIDGKTPMKTLTPEEATHSVVFSSSCRYFVDNFSRADLEPRSFLRDNRGKKIMELSRPDLKRLYESGWKMPKAFSVKAADGITDLYGFMWTPFDMDSTRKYPIISYVYPGPQTESIPLSFFNALNTHHAPLAQVGFIVVTFGHRGGSPLRDKWYHTYGYGNLRDYPLADDKYGIEQLADRHSFIDITKVGIFGHSGGGFMSTAALCTYPDFYTAAVSSAGNHDNNIYNRGWGETHHGIQEIRKKITYTAKDKKNGKDSTYTKDSITFKTKIPTNMELASRLKGHLMLVTGDVDDNVHPGNTFRMADALLRAGKNFDLVILPGQAHWFSDEQKSFYVRKMWFHFGKHLLGDYSSETFSEIDGYKRK